MVSTTSSSVTTALIPTGTSNTGESYVVFGKAAGFDPVVNLAALAPADGFRITGINQGDQSGRAVSGAGDVNGDGLSDVIIGARLADPEAVTPFDIGFAGVTNDVWDVSNGINIVDASATLGGVGSVGIFGGATVGGQTIFLDNQPQGFTHFVEWTTPADVVIQSYHLGAAHDGHSVGRDANERGFSQFTLFAFNDLSGEFDIVLSDFVVPVGDDNAIHPGENAQLYDPDALFSVEQNILNIGADVDQLVSTDRFRAEFVQFGPASPTESGPRIFELDGFMRHPPAIPMPARAMWYSARRTEIRWIYPRCSKVTAASPSTASIHMTILAFP